MPESLTWNEPRWAFVPKLWASYRILLSPRSLGVITVVTIAVAVVLLGGLRLAVPNIVFPNLWPALFALPLMLLGLALQGLLLVAITPVVSITPQHVKRTHGNSGFQVRASDIQWARLYFHPLDRVRLKIHCRLCRSDQTITLGLPSDADLDTLIDLLPAATLVFDARRRQSKPAG